MLLIPALDLREGRCVRLLRGDPRKQTVYSEDPVGTALKWQGMGAKMLHVVDLDGAFRGKSENHRVIEKMASRLKIPFQVGGGLRRAQEVERILSLGARRVVLGTAAAESPEFLEQMVREHGEKIVVGLDARNGKVAVKGWVEEAEIEALDLARRVEAAGVKTVVFTDIQRDGTLQGPNLDSTRELAYSTSLSIIVSGGISSLEDLREVRELEKDGVSGVIVGKALYAGEIDLKEALEVIDAPA